VEQHRVDPLHPGRVLAAQIEVPQIFRTGIQ